MHQLASSDSPLLTHPNSLAHPDSSQLTLTQPDSLICIQQAAMT
jgi:hypothetical protein